jgi:hypothetical protein
MLRKHLHPIDFLGQHTAHMAHSGLSITDHHVVSKGLSDLLHGNSTSNLAHSVQSTAIAADHVARFSDHAINPILDIHFPAFTHHAGHGFSGTDQLFPVGHDTLHVCGINATNAEGIASTSSVQSHFYPFQQHVSVHPPNCPEYLFPLQQTAQTVQTSHVNTTSGHTQLTNEQIKDMTDSIIHNIHRGMGYPPIKIVHYNNLDPKAENAYYQPQGDLGLPRHHIGVNDAGQKRIFARFGPIGNFLDLGHETSHGQQYSTGQDIFLPDPERNADYLTGVIAHRFGLDLRAGQQFFRWLGDQGNENPELRQQQGYQDGLGRVADFTLGYHDYPSVWNKLVRVNTKTIVQKIKEWLGDNSS